VIRVLIVDDQDLVRRTTLGLLRPEPGIVVVGQCVDGAEVLEAVAALRPDVVLMDVEMPLMSGLEATRRLLAARPSVRVLITTASALASTPEDAAEAGAVGWLSKGRGRAVLAEAIRTVASGGEVWPPEFSRRPGAPGTP
jgi:DNA-binding NarL/FixJ family response regulator